MVPFILGMTDLQRKLKDVDCILEVHDARVRYYIFYSYCCYHVT